MTKRTIMRDLLLTALIIGASCLYGQERLPYSPEHVLVFIEPFEDLGPDHAQDWLRQGIPDFMVRDLADTPMLTGYAIKDHSPRLVDRPHRYAEMIWSEVFQRQVDGRYLSYVILGEFSYLNGNIRLHVDLLSLVDTRVLASFDEEMPYVRLLGWKAALARWVEEQIEAHQSGALQRKNSETMVRSDDRFPGIPNRPQLGSFYNRQETQPEQDLARTFKTQQQADMGSQLETLWKDVTFRPYQATIFDIQTQRLQWEPDSVDISFKVSYRINPRILDEIDHFSKTRNGQVEQSSHYAGHAFMDLGYIDADFTEDVAAGTWRMVPLIRMGKDGSPRQRVLYHSFPRPIQPPTQRHINKGEFKPLLMAIPGVNALRIFVQEEEQVLEYQLRVGYDEMSDLDKIKVHFVSEQDLSNHL